MTMKDYRVLEPLGKGAFASVFKVGFAPAAHRLSRARRRLDRRAHTPTQRAEGPALIATHAHARRSSASRTTRCTR